MKIIFLEPLGIANEELKSIVSSYIQEDCVYYDSKPSSEEEIIKRAKDADVIVLAQVPITKNVIDHCPNLKYIDIAFTGVDHVDVAYAKSKGIKVSNASGYSTSAVADLVFGLTISLLRNIPQCDDATKSSRDKTGLIGYELDGKTFGVVGSGKIGSRVIEIAKAFGCKVLVYSRTDKHIEGTEFVSLEELLRRSDIVSLHIPSNSETYHLLGKDQLSLMKKSAILINCARGPVVDNEELAYILNNDLIAGAGIDVFDKEPPLSIDYCLYDAKNCILTPHVGFATHEAFVKRAHIISDNLKAYQENNFKNLV